MIQYYSGLFFSLFVLNVQAQVNLTESNLPIIVIESLSSINADSKVNAEMKVYYNEDGAINKLTDTPDNFDGNIAIKFRGQSSLALFEKKGYSIETRDEFWEDKDVNLLGMPEEEDWVLNGPYSDKSLMRNALMYTLADSITPYSPRVQMVEVIINDDYQGVYLFTEKIKRDDNRVDVAKLNEDEISGDDLTGGYILKFDKAEPEEVGWVSPYSIGESQPTNFVLVYPDHDDIVPEQKAYIQNWMTEFEDLLAGSDYTDEEIGYRKSINTESFIDYILLNELSRNVDGYRLSTFMFKDKESKDGELHIGPVWDYNLAFGNANYCAGSNIEGWAYEFNNVCAGDKYQVHFWWERLLSDPSFRAELAEKWMKLRNGKFSNENINSLIDGFESQLSEPQSRNFEKWNILGIHVWPNVFIGDTYESEVEYLRTWLMDRLEWMDNAFDIDVSSEEVGDSGILISPNPVSNLLKIEGVNLDVNTGVEVLDNLGIVIKTPINKSTSSIDVSNLRSGIYFVRIINGNNKTTKRFIKM